MPDDLKLVSREENGFILFSEEEAGILIGVILACALIYDFLQRLLERIG